MTKSLFFTSTLLIFMTASVLASASNVDSSIYYTGNGCVPMPDETADYEYSVHGIQNMDTSETLEVFCPLNYTFLWSADYSNPTFDETRVVAKVFDNSQYDSIACRVYGSSGTEGTSGYFSYGSTSWYYSSSYNDPEDLNISSVGTTFANAKYFFLYCEIPPRDHDFPPSQILGYVMDIMD